MERKRDALYERLNKARLSIQKGGEVTAGEKKRILKERAKRLAKEDNIREQAESYLEVIEFLLAHERYGIETTHIREVYPLKELTPLPCTPPFILGIINVRGQILPVIDIKKFFDLPEKGLTNLNKVIIVRKEDMELGILADEIHGIRNILRGKIQPPLPTLTGIHAEYLKGITEERLVVLDVMKILSDKNIVVNEEVI